MGYIPSLPPLLILESSRRGRQEKPTVLTLICRGLPEDWVIAPNLLKRSQMVLGWTRGLEGQSNDSGPNLQLEPATLISLPPRHSLHFADAKEPGGCGHPFIGAKSIKHCFPALVF